MKLIYQKIKKQYGGAIILTLLCLTLLSVISMGFIGISLNQSKISYNYYLRSKLFYLAKSGISRAQLELEKNPDWQQTTAETITVDGNKALVRLTVTPSSGNASNTCKIWTVKSTATMGTSSRTVTAILESESFARYAMFTHDTSWIYEKSNSPDIYDGPIHSNGYFIIYGKPKFKSPLTSSNIKDSYYNPTEGVYKQGSDKTTDPSLFYHYISSYDNDKPEAEEGINTFYFAGGQPPRDLPSTVSEQQSNATIVLDNNAVITFLPSGNMEIITSEGTFVKSTDNVTVYAKGSIQVEGTLKGNVSLVSDADIYITDNILYKDKTLDTLALVAKNHIVLSVDKNDVRDIEIDAMLFSLNAGFYVEDYWRGKPRGTLKLFGGLVQKYQYQTGIYSWIQRKLVAGYNKNIIFDPRFLQKPPINSPTTGKIRIKSWNDKAAL